MQTRGAPLPPWYAEERIALRRRSVPQGNVLAAVVDRIGDIDAVVPSQVTTFSTVCAGGPRELHGTSRTPTRRRTGASRREAARRTRSRCRGACPGCLLGLGLGGGPSPARLQAPYDRIEAIGEVRDPNGRSRATPVAADPGSIFHSPKPNSQTPPPTAIEPSTTGTPSNTKIRSLTKGKHPCEGQFCRGLSDISPADNNQIWPLFSRNSQLERDFKDRCTDLLLKHENPGCGINAEQV